jgi:hypothetical protein
MDLFWKKFPQPAASSGRKDGALTLAAAADSAGWIIHYARYRGKSVAVKL